MSAPMEGLKTALRRQKSTRAKREALQLKIAEIDQRRTARRSDDERRQERELDRDSDAAIAGHAISPTLDGNRATVRVEQADKIDARAREKLRAQLIGPLVDEERQTSVSVIAEALAFAISLRDEGRAGAVDHLSAFLPHLALLKAAARVKERYAGTEFAFDAKRFPPSALWDSSIVVDRLIKAIPDRIKPTGFDEALEAETRRIVAEKVAELEGEE